LEGNTLREDEPTQIEAKDAIATASEMPCESITITDKVLYNSVGLSAMLSTHRLEQQSKKFLAAG